MTDAAHLLSDVTGFAVAAVASHLASRKSARTFSFGSVLVVHVDVFPLLLPHIPDASNAGDLACRYHRAEVLGALISVLIIWIVTGILMYEALLRIVHPGHTKGKRKSID